MGWGKLYIMACLVTQQQYWFFHTISDFFCNQVNGMC